jgi:hypothetical protein
MRGFPLLLNGTDCERSFFSLERLPKYQAATRQEILDPVTRSGLKESSRCNRLVACPRPAEERLFDPPACHGRFQALVLLSAPFFTLTEAQGSFRNEAETGKMQ